MSAVPELFEVGPTVASDPGVTPGDGDTLEFPAAGPAAVPFLPEDPAVSMYDAESGCPRQSEIDWIFKPGVFSTVGKKWFNDRATVWLKRSCVRTAYHDEKKRKLHEHGYTVSALVT